MNYPKAAENRKVFSFDLKELKAAAADLKVSENQILKGKTMVSESRPVPEDLRGPDGSSPTTGSEIHFSP